jgi:MAF protein
LPAWARQRRPPHAARSTVRLILASASPRRQTLIGLLGLDWRAAPSALDEDLFLLGDPFVSALNVALAKARTTTTDYADVVVAADTIVASDGQSLGKPADATTAAAMLLGLRGRAHEVLTGVALRTSDGREWGAVVSTRVIMRSYAETEIAAYVARGEPFDKAGGYAVQDTEFRPVERCEGCYLNVVGLPLCAVAAGLAALKVAVEPARQPPCRYCVAGAPLVEIAQDPERSIY